MMLRIALSILAVIGLLAAPVTAQSLDLSRTVCTGIDPSKPKVAAFVPAQVTIGGSTVTVSTPICLALGANLQVNMAAAGGPALEAVIPTAPPPIPVVVPKMKVEWVSLVALAPGSNWDQESVTYTLMKTPAPDTLVMAFLRSSRVGAGTLDVVQPGATTPKVLNIQLPNYRPFTTEDQVVVVYWTTE